MELDALLYVTVTICRHALNIAPGAYIRISIVRLQRGSLLQFSMAATSAGKVAVCTGIWIWHYEERHAKALMSVWLTAFAFCK